MIGPAASTLPGANAPETLSRERLELRKAAEGFEAIMVRRMLAAARASSLAEDAPLTGGARGQFQAMQDEYFAEIAASTGSLGFARSIEERLAQHLSGKDDPS